jgi:hypothetical protein
VKQTSEGGSRRRIQRHPVPGPAATSVPSLHPLDEFDVAMRVIADFGQSIQNADAKSGMLGALLGLLIAGVTTELQAVRATVSAPAPVSQLAIGLLSAFTVSLVAAGLCLGLTQLPRISAPHRLRRLAFPALSRQTGDTLGRPTATELRDEAWCQAETLARIARLKFRYVRVGLVWTGLCALAFVSWLALAAMVS